MLHLSKEVVHSVTGCLVVATENPQQPQDAHLRTEAGESEQMDRKLFWCNESGKIGRRTKQ